MLAGALLVEHHPAAILFRSTPIPSISTFARRSRRSRVNRAAGVLHNLAIETRLEQQLPVVEPRNDQGAHRSERVGAFGPPPLQVLLLAALPIALADVVTARYAEDHAGATAKPAAAARTPLLVVCIQV